MRSENISDRSNISSGSSTKCENAESEERRYDDLVMHGIVCHSVNGTGKQSILAGNRPGRLCTTVCQPGKRRNLRMGHSVGDENFISFGVVSDRVGVADYRCF